MARVDEEPRGSEPRGWREWLARYKSSLNKVGVAEVIPASRDEMSDFLSLSNAVTLASIVVASTSIVYGAVHVTKAIVELWRGRSTGWLKIIFAIFEIPESQSERTIFPHSSGFVLIENHGPFEEFISALNYSVEGKGLVQVQCYRQLFDRAIDLIAGNSYE